MKKEKSSKLFNKNRFFLKKSKKFFSKIRMKPIFFVLLFFYFSIQWALCGCCYYSQDMNYLDYFCTSSNCQCASSLYDWSSNYYILKNCTSCHSSCCLYLDNYYDSSCPSSNCICQSSFFCIYYDNSLKKTTAGYHNCTGCLTNCCHYYRSLSYEDSACTSLYCSCKSSDYCVNNSNSSINYDSNCSSFYCSCASSYLCANSTNSEYQNCTVCETNCCYKNSTTCASSSFCTIIISML